MKDYEEKLREFESLLGKEDAASNQRRAEIVEWLKANGGDEAKAAAEKMITRRLQDADKDIKTIREQLGDTYALLPISYISRHYFGKSAAWLHQRVNGYRVRGKVYTLDEDQKRTFNAAVQDIAKEIGSFHLV